MEGIDNWRRFPVRWSSNSSLSRTLLEPQSSCSSANLHCDSPRDQATPYTVVNAQFRAKITHIMKIGKNNFKLPPQVESSVVRIEPKMGAERPGVSWDEWDGMLRICFVGKNRTMRASWLGTKEVLGYGREQLSGFGAR
jgi:16S rRNA A1518/A1519 N6-dimethyltransferase RsmA/KsgA/DIM1 with predicted DNA glycosylase/AP lyase activity